MGVHSDIGGGYADTSSEPPFNSGRWEQSKYLSALANRKKTKRGKAQKERDRSSFSRQLGQR
jgi:hypothetical protein